MNQLYRALHMPPARLLRKLRGEKEVYTIAIRPAPTGDGCAPLPALGAGAYTPLPYTPGKWWADPLLYLHDGKPYLFCEEFDMAAAHGSLVVAELDENGTPGPFTTVLNEPFHLSFPNVFDWNGEIWMLPETGADHSLRLYRCKSFPNEWECVQRFEVGRELCDAIIIEKTDDALTVLCSETRPENQLYVRYRRYTVEKCADPLDIQGTEGPEGADNGLFVLREDEAYNLDHREFDLTSRNAGRLFTLDGQSIHPTQVSTTVDYGVYLQFTILRAGGEAPLCAATPQNVTITGIDAADIIGVHTYCRGAGWEIIDARYLRKP